MEGFRHARMVDCTSGTVPINLNGYREYRLLSTDTKPTTSLSTGDMVVELDTQDIYYWSGDAWVLYVSLYTVKEFDSISELRTMVPATDTTEAYVKGYYTPGDGADGKFYWDSESTATDNNGTIICPTGHTTAGRWARLSGNEINLRWFGAKGDGLTNDTTAFLAALDVLSENDSLFVPSGTYIIDNDSCIITTDNIRVFGNGTLKTLVSDTTVGYFIRVQASGFKIDGITLDGGASLLNGSEPIKTGLTIETPADGSVISDISVTNCRIINWTTYGIGITENSDDISIKNAINNVRIDSNYVTAGTICIENFPKVVSTNIIVNGNYCQIIGDMLSSAGETTCIKPCEVYDRAVVTNNICIGGATSGMAIGLYSKHLLVANNVVLSTGAAIGINHTSHAAYSTTPADLLLDYIEISNNVFVSSASVGMIINGIYDFTSMRISNNHIGGYTYSLYMQPLDTATGNLKDVAFNDNRFVGKSKIFRSDDNTKHIEGVRFDGDTFNGQVDLQYVKDAVLVNCKFVDSTTFGVQLTGCAYVAFKNSIFKNLATEGCVLSSGNNINFSECEFVNCNTSNTASTNCLNVVGTPSYIFVKDCIFENEASVGYATRAIYVAAGTNIFVNLGNVYVGMVNASMVYFGVIVYAEMCKAYKVHYGTGIPSTEYATTAFSAYDQAINVAPSEAGSGGGKYVIDGWVCSVAGTPGTWLEKRSLTGN